MTRAGHRPQAEAVEDSPTHAPGPACPRRGARGPGPALAGVEVK